MANSCVLLPCLCTHVCKFARWSAASLVLPHKVPIASPNQLRLPEIPPDIAKCPPAAQSPPVQNHCPAHLLSCAPSGHRHHLRLCWPSMGLPQQAGGAGPPGTQRGRKHRKDAQFLASGSLFPQRVFKLILRTQTNEIQVGLSD